jgi:cysteinyl-tRNA synthetase
MKEEKVDVPKSVLDLVEKRKKARLEKDWVESDKLRDKIKELGFEIFDNREGIKIKKIKD